MESEAQPEQQRGTRTQFNSSKTLLWGRSTLRKKKHFCRRCPICTVWMSDLDTLKNRWKKRKTADLSEARQTQLIQSSYQKCSDTTAATNTKHPWIGTETWYSIQPRSWNRLPLPVIKQDIEIIVDSSRTMSVKSKALKARLRSLPLAAAGSSPFLKRSWMVNKRLTRCFHKLVRRIQKETSTAPRSQWTSSAIHHQQLRIQGAWLQNQHCTCRRYKQAHQKTRPAK